jgi:hypothetical protein
MQLSCRIPPAAGMATIQSRQLRSLTRSFPVVVAALQDRLTVV